MEAGIRRAAKRIIAWACSKNWKKNYSTKGWSASHEIDAYREAQRRN